ncbi:MAG: hypothetical protein DI538_24800 [Azospira oryzae]|nr:MAG: hypothetical protein DI538_24800 [Azospira oryzae]
MSKKRTAALGLAMIVVISLIISCANEKFDKNKWNSNKDAGSPPAERSKMLEDLLAGRKWEGLSYNDVIELVGPPDFSDSIHFLYDIETNYGFDIDPIYTKQLIYYLSSDSIVTRFEVKESTKE